MNENNVNRTAVKKQDMRLQAGLKRNKNDYW